MKNPEMKTAVIIQARKGSQRLPNKIVKPFFQEKGILEILIREVKKLELPLIVATTTHEIDDEVEQLCQKEKVSCFRGSEENVLNRFVKAARTEDYDVVYRVCADNPFLSVSYMKELGSAWEDSLDYVCHRDGFGHPAMKTHFGFFAEMVRISALEKVLSVTKDPLYLEHVTNFVYEHPDMFSLHWLHMPDFLRHRNDIRMTVDTEEDFRTMQELYQLKIEQNWESMDELVVWLDNHPEFLAGMKKNIKANTK
ncbi:cytidylyltransferase domain-containing protein [Prolixibacter sp. SD074]|uniref:cytidylyltransferase domain-containing protein n=1 Tax=Prolixibacter sp. SD074 TaxID=2652391 RepID=UPI0012990FC4|nr:glycosyl transferase family 2 [Prolixibacter sp. SD074]